MPTKNKTAIIHDWCVSSRGGENILRSVLHMHPTAEVFTLFYSKNHCIDELKSRTVHTSWLQKLPFVRKYYPWLLFLFPWTIEQFDLNEFDLVISSSHCVAKGVIPSPTAKHICYCHTPMRYSWDRFWEYFKNPVLRFFISVPMHFIRQWDVTSNSRVDIFIANSSFTASRIRRYYARESEVIFPFVNDIFLSDPLHLLPTKEDYYLVVGAMVSYKRMDLAILACNKLGRKLVIVGEGPERKNLEKLAGPNVRFLGRVENLVETYQKAQAFLFPGLEDFGITPLEAMASGTAVIAFSKGGVTDSVIENKTGIFFEEQNVDSLCTAILKFESNRGQFSSETCRRRAREFSESFFQNSWIKVLNSQGISN